MTTEQKEEKKRIPTYWKNQEPPQSGSPFEDPLFPPNSNSLLGLDSKGNPIDSKAYSEKAKNINTNEIGFFRAKEIFNDDYNLFSDKIEMGDVQQGTLGDCYFLSSVANLCKFPNMVKQMFRQSAKNDDGFYEISLFIDGKRQIIIIDDYLPAFKKNKKPCYAQSNKNEIWVMLLEKAWAKVNGGYANIISGLPCEALEFLTGTGSLIYDFDNIEQEDIEEYKREIIKNVQLADQNNCLISCSTSANSSIQKVGLVEGHAYSLVSFYKIETSQNKSVYLFRIRNPWSKGEWTGDWSDKSKLWDSKAKSQVSFDNKDDGIFFMNDSDFFKYFTHVEICYMIFDSKSIFYQIEGEENIKNASVFNIEAEGDGFLSVSVSRESWRANRTLRDKILPTHISIVKYDPSASNRLKTFSNYNGTFESFRTCTLNVRIAKGNYLVYVYRDFDHAGYQAEKVMNVKIICSAEFKHAQMSYDERDKGFPLLQNIILQAQFEENNFDPESGEDFNTNGNQLRGNGIGSIIYYISTPGYYMDFTGGTAKVKNYIMLSPYLDSKTTTFHRAIPSGKYLIFLGLMSGVYGAYSFNCFTKAYTTNRKLNPEFDNNNIDLTLYTDSNNNLKNPNFKERKTQSLERAKKEFYGEIGDGKLQFKSLDELQKEYGEYLKLLDDIEVSSENNNLRWGIIKGEYVTFVGQFNGEKKEGKGLYINPNNIFAGEFKNDQQNGKGYTYNNKLEKIFYCIYENGTRKGKPVSVEQEIAEIEKLKAQAEEEMQKEQERLKKIEEEKEDLLKKQEEERKRKEEELAEKLKKAEEERKRQEEELAEKIKKAEEDAKAEALRIEEERQKQIQMEKERLEKIAKEEQEKLEQAAKKAEEFRQEQMKKAEEELKAAEELKKAQEEKIKQDLEKLANDVSDEVNAKKEELAKQKEELEKKTQKQIEEAQKKIEDAKQKAEEKAEELKNNVKNEIEEEKKKVEDTKKQAEENVKKLKEDAEKKAEEARQNAQKLKEEAEKKAEDIRKEAEKTAEEAKQKVENIKSQIQKTRDDAKKMADGFTQDIQKRKRKLEESQRIAQERRKKQMERLEQSIRDGQFGIQISYPDYMKRSQRQIHQQDQLGFNQDVIDVCTCGCNIF